MSTNVFPIPTGIMTMSLPKSVTLILITFVVTLLCVVASLLTFVRLEEQKITVNVSAPQIIVRSLVTSLCVFVSILVLSRRSVVVTARQVTQFKAEHTVVIYMLPRPHLASKGIQKTVPSEEIQRHRKLFCEYPALECASELKKEKDLQHFMQSSMDLCEAEARIGKYEIERILFVGDFELCAEAAAYLPRVPSRFAVWYCYVRAS